MFESASNRSRSRTSGRSGAHDTAGTDAQPPSRCKDEQPHRSPERAPRPSDQRKGASRRRLTGPDAGRVRVVPTDEHARPPQRTKAPGRIAETHVSAGRSRRFRAFRSISRRNVRKRRESPPLSCVMAVAGAAVVRFGRAGVVAPVEPFSLQNERPQRYVEAGSAAVSAAAAAAADASRRSTSARTTGATRVPNSSIACMTSACATAPTLICAR